jgi:hypothetical protein
MAPRNFKLTPDVRHSIVAFITAGAFPHIAAEAAGIPAAVFEQWLARGNPLNRRRGWKPHKLYTPLWHGVMQATAQARLTAEVQALREDAVRWLMQGPGKERPHTPGWTQTVRPQPAHADAEPNLLLDSRMQEVFRAVLQALTPFPEARAAVARALAGTSALTPAALPDRRAP